jgi:hypothetical protein
MNGVFYKVCFGAKVCASISAIEKVASTDLIKSPGADVEHGVEKRRRRRSLGRHVHRPPCALHPQLSHQPVGVVQHEFVHDLRHMTNKQNTFA